MFSRYTRWNTEIFISLHVFTQEGGLEKKIDFMHFAEFCALVCEIVKTRDIPGVFD